MPLGFRGGVVSHVTPHRGPDFRFPVNDFRTYPLYLEFELRLHLDVC